MKMQKKKLVVTIIASLLAVVLLVLYWQLPYYWIKKEAIAKNENFEAKQVKVMSYNIRCKTPLDFGKKNWFYRANLVIDCIEEAAPGVIGFQEVTTEQYDYLCDTLTGYASVITYRDNSIFKEGCPLFYNEEQYEVVMSECFWLSETPEVMSKDWGAAHNRICSFALLKDKASGLEFMVFNTHLDHVSDEARINGIQVVLDKIAEYDGVPAILMGDLNAEESSETYKSAMESFLDVKYETEHTMTSPTYQNWGAALDRNCIDYILISQTGFQVNFYEVIQDTYNGVYSSDHFPLMAELELVAE